MAHKRRCTRRSTKNLVLFSSDTTLGWRVIFTVSYLKGEKNVAAGIWRRVNSQLGDHIGYQILCTQNCGLDIPSNSSPTYISAAEIVLYATRSFVGRGSRTEGLSEEERFARRGKFDKILPIEDAVERVTGKVEQWPFPASRIGTAEDGSAIYGDRATRVYPHAQ